MKNTDGVNIVTAVKDPFHRDYETEWFDSNGHLYIYRYLAGQGRFSRATQPSGAAAPIFHLLKEQDRIPIGGWLPLVY